eukprot:226877-Chlamydomonas_euryale.AAC.1
MAWVGGGGWPWWTMATGTKREGKAVEGGGGPYPPPPCTCPPSLPLRGSERHQYTDGGTGRQYRAWTPKVVNGYPFDLLTSTPSSGFRCSAPSPWVLIVRLIPL